MSEILRTIAADTARTTAAALISVGVKIPAEAQEQYDRLDRLDAERPVPVTQQDLIAAYLNEEPADAIEQKALRSATHRARNDAWTEAKIKVGQAASAALIANGNDIAAQLQATAEPLVEALRAAALIDTLDTTTLIRAGRDQEAALAARVDIHAGELEKLYALRDKVTRGADYGQDHGHDCRRWTDPRAFIAANELVAPATTATEGFLRGIRAGAGLWFPLPAEAVKKAQTIATDRESRRAAEARADIEARGGRVAAR